MGMAALVPFAVLVRLVRGGHAGWAMAVLCVIGGSLAVLFYASGRPFGVDPVFAMSVALLLAVPALLGGGAGALLGWMLRKRDDQKIT